MTVPHAFGRNLPLTDWEGDDFTPGSGGAYVTCMDTSAGRMVAWATNGRVVHDGKWYRSHLSKPDPNGITLTQAAQAVHSGTGLTLVEASMTLSQRLSWLRAGKGLVVAGMYSSVPRAYRFQASANFSHAMFFCYISHDGKMIRKYDPLNPNVHAYGEFIPLAQMVPFLSSLPAWKVGYVALQPL